MSCRQAIIRKRMQKQGKVPRHSQKGGKSTKKFISEIRIICMMYEDTSVKLLTNSAVFVEKCLPLQLGNQRHDIE